METRANYILVGGFVLLLLAGLTAFVLWFAKLQFDTEFDRYHIKISGSVTGLNPGSPVRYSGVRVGEVIAVELDREQPSEVLVTIEVEAITPVREDTTASLEIEGLTGARYVLLSGGAPGSKPLLPKPGEKLATIPSRPSGLQKVIEGAPELLASANQLLFQANEFLNSENRENVALVLENLKLLTGALAARADDIGTLIDSTGETMKSVSRASASLEQLLVQVRNDSSRLADRVDDAVAAVEQLTGTLDDSVGAGTESLQALLVDLQGSAQAFTGMANEIEDMVSENREPIRDFTAGGLYELNTLLIEARALLNGLNRVTTEVQRDPARFLFGDQQRGYEAGQR